MYKEQDIEALLDELHRVAEEMRAKYPRRWHEGDGVTDEPADDPADFADDFAPAPIQWARWPEPNF